MNFENASLFCVGAVERAIPDLTANRCETAMIVITLFWQADSDQLSVVHCPLPKSQVLSE
jgi:hypothetical protein